MQNPNAFTSAIRLLLGAALWGLVAFPMTAADLVPFSDITPAQAAAMIVAKGADPLFKIIDVRTPAEFAESRIKGAVNIDVKAPDFKEKVEKLDRKGFYLAVCRGGVRSARAMSLMKESGFKQVYNLAGGLMKWQEEKRPLETVPSQAAAPSACGPTAPDPGTYAWLNGKKSTTVPFRLYRNHVHVEAEFNGARKLELILDTGMPAPGVLLMGGAAVRELNLAYAGEARVGGAGGGSFPAKVAAGVALRIGDLLLREQTAIVKADAADQAGQGVNETIVDASGVIGFALFGRLVVAIDYDRMLLTLSEPDDFNYQGQGSRLPLAFESNFPFVDCAAQLAHGKSVSLKMIVDLGATHALSLNIGAQPDIQAPGKFIRFWGRGAGGEVSGRLGRIRSLSLGKYALSNIVAGFHDAKLMPLEKDGNLGSDVLRRFNLIFDYSRRTMIMEPNSHFNEPFETAMSGILAEKVAPGEFVIRHILPESPASEAKLQENDRILEINGLPAGQMSNDDLFSVSSKEGESLKLNIRRGEVRFGVVLKLRRLI